MAITRLTQRKQFLFVARGLRAQRACLIVQARKSDDDRSGIGSGFTATKKTGNAVRRNRAKRRLRAASQQLLPRFGHDGWDYVFIARKQTASTKWTQLLDDMKAALLSLRNNSGTRRTSNQHPRHSG